MARILVAYATKHGSTAGVAEAIARALETAGLEAGVAPFPNRGLDRGL